MAQKRKRGGLAGIWDRNKGLIKTVVPTVVGAFGGPAGVPMAAMTRAAMEGLDRPGKRGIGLDLGAYARGAAVGAGQGATGSMARSGLQRMLAPNVPGVSGTMPGARMTPGAQPGQTALTTTTRTAAQAPGGLKETMGGFRSASSRLGDLLTGGARDIGRTATQETQRSLLGRIGEAALRPEVLSKGVGGLLNMLPSPDSDIAAERNQLERERLGEQKRLNDVELQRRQLIMQMLMPYLQQYLPQLNYGAAGGAPQPPR